MKTEMAVECCAASGYQELIPKKALQLICEAQFMPTRYFLVWRLKRLMAGHLTSQDITRDSMQRVKLKVISRFAIDLQCSRRKLWLYNLKKWWSHRKGVR